MGSGGDRVDAVRHNGICVAAFFRFGRGTLGVWSNFQFGTAGNGERL